MVSDVGISTTNYLCLSKDNFTEITGPMFGRVQFLQITRMW